MQKTLFAKKKTYDIDHKKFISITSNITDVHQENNCTDEKHLHNHY